MLYINQQGQWKDGVVPEKGDMVVHRVRKTFHDIAWYYANIIDYCRVLLGIIALVIILYSPEYKLTIGFLIMSNVLLDWVDGPVARAYKQSSAMGCGWDWLADILAQYCLAIWCMQVQCYITSFVVLFTTIEIATGLFDFATSAQSMYPVQNSDDTPWYFIVENWLTPGGVYNNLGTFCWLVNTIYPIFVCLDVDDWICHLLLPFAVLYAWHEVSQAVFIIENWKETTATFAVGINYMRSCVALEKTLLESVYEVSAGFLNLKQNHDESSEKKGLIMWGNLFVDDKFNEDFKKSDLSQPFHNFVLGLVNEMYADEREIISYGFIVSPKDGSETQDWHHDYSQTVSNLFIPLVQTTSNNATEFIRHPEGEMKVFQDEKFQTKPLLTPIKDEKISFDEVATVLVEQDKEQFHPAPHHMFETEKTEHLEISQVICQPFSILKLTPGCIHRGIANKENYDRVMFFISTNVKGHKVVIEEDFDGNIEVKENIKK